MSTSTGSFGNFGNIGLAYINKKQAVTLASATDTQLGGFNAKITPVSSSNNTLCLCSFSGYQAQQGGFSFARNGTNLSAATGFGSRNVAQFADGFNATSNNAACSFAAYLDSPATTSVTTYSLLDNNQGVAVSINQIGASTAYIGSSYFIVLEI
jgi:hypothetical protein